MNQILLSSSIVSIKYCSQQIILFHICFLSPQKLFEVPLRNNAQDDLSFLSGTLTNQLMNCVVKEPTTHMFFFCIVNSYSMFFCMKIQVFCSILFLIDISSNESGLKILWYTDYQLLLEVDQIPFMNSNMPLSSLNDFLLLERFIQFFLETMESWPLGYYLRKLSFQVLCSLNGFDNKSRNVMKFHPVSINHFHYYIQNK